MRQSLQQRGPRHTHCWCCDMLTQSLIVNRTCCPRTCCRSGVPVSLFQCQHGAGHGVQSEMALRAAVGPAGTCGSHRGGGSGVGNGGRHPRILILGDSVDRTVVRDVCHTAAGLIDNEVPPLPPRPPARTQTTIESDEALDTHHGLRGADLREGRPIHARRGRWAESLVGYHSLAEIRSTTFRL